MWCDHDMIKEEEQRNSVYVCMYKIRVEVCHEEALN